QSAVKLAQPCARRLTRRIGFIAELASYIQTIRATDRAPRVGAARLPPCFSGPASAGTSGSDGSAFRGRWNSAANGGGAAIAAARPSRTSAAGPVAGTRPATIPTRSAARVGMPRRKRQDSVDRLDLRGPRDEGLALHVLHDDRGGADVLPRHRIPGRCKPHAVAL